MSLWKPKKKELLVASRIGPDMRPPSPKPRRRQVGLRIGSFELLVRRTNERVRLMRGLRDKQKLGETIFGVISRLGLVNEGLEVIGHVVAVLTTPKGKLVYETCNLVTDTGDIHYPQRIEEAASAGPAPTNAFGIMELGTTHSGVPAKGNNRSVVTAFTTSSQKAFDAGYPLENDPDGDNTGSGVDILTFLVSYTTGEANDTAIKECIITNVSPGASEPILTHADFSPTFNKTSSDTLKVFVNHTFTGV